MDDKQKIAFVSMKLGDVLKRLRDVKPALEGHDVPDDLLNELDVLEAEWIDLRDRIKAAIQGDT